MNDAKKRKQIRNGDRSSDENDFAQSRAFFDSAYISSTSHSVNLLDQTEANTASSTKRDDDSVLAESVKCNHWSEKVRSISDFGTLAELNLSALRKSGKTPFQLKYNKTESIGIGGWIFNAHWIAAAFFAVVVIKMVIVTAPYANNESFFEVTSYAQEKFHDVLNWTNSDEFRTRLIPLICGLIVSVFSYMMVYFDSSIPGINPPSPFSSKSHKVYRRSKQSPVSLAYMTAIASGIVVGGLMYFQL